MVFEKLKVILSNQFDVEEDSITMDSSIVDDFNADSLDFIDLIMSIEDEFEIEVPDDDIEGIKTVGDIVKYIENNQ
ncbi:MAG: acyl carrier protein [Acutalibacteraceae bacterium]|nr:acyl carrier protein [Acutalibacteraceae bacterium]